MELTANCDLTTGKISGCKSGSKMWWHEKGHFVFNKDPRYSLLILLRGYLGDVWLFLTMISVKYHQLFKFAFFFWLLYFLIFLYEEWWCNDYSQKKFKRFLNVERF